MENERAGPIPAREQTPAMIRSPDPSIAEGLLVLSLFVLTQLAVGFLLAPLANEFQWPKGVLIASASLLVSHAVGWGALYYLLARRRGLPMFHSLGLGAVSPWPLIPSLLGGIALQLLVAVVAFVVPPPADFESAFQMFADAGWFGAAALGVMALGMAPLLEEALFRGLLLPALRRRLNFLPSALIVTGLFTALHATQTGTYWPAIAGIFVCGFSLAWLRDRTGSLWAPVFFHVGFNLLALLALLASM